MGIYAVVLLDGTRFQVGNPAPVVVQVTSIEFHPDKPLVLVYGKDKTIHIPYHSVLYYVPL